ncbi:MAG TPA: membrane protein insertase YidC [Methylomirabilota bacterium]|nr:membrane protein insertase YidC [Methylomirabilota bacterium]
MEKRAALAFGLSILLLLAYLWVMESYFTPPRSREVETGAAPPTAAPPATTPTPTPIPTPAPGPGPAAAGEPGPLVARPAQSTMVVSGPLYRGLVSSEGGKLQEWTLQYRGDKPMVIVGELGPRGLVPGGDLAAADPLAMSLGPRELKLGRENPSGEAVLQGELSGLRVRETLKFDAGQYTIDAHIRVENTTASPRTLTLSLPWLYRHDEKTPGGKFPGQLPTEVVWAARGRVERVEDLKAVGRHEAEGGAWVAIGSTWYLAALVPKSPGFTLVAEGDKKEGKEEYRVAIAVRAGPTIAPGQAWEGRVILYIGPKEYDRLAALGLEGTVNFGGFPLPQRYGGLPMEWLGVPILKLMNWLHGFVANYGVVIILLTVVSKVLFYPLTVKSLKSMKAMQTLQPQINALRSRYRSEPRKLQEETMALYRKHRVNPMGGCLPMVAQVPIFYALYLALSVSVELQNAPFLCFGRAFGVDLWICDLASYDPTYILPILMGVSMFIQQKMTPTMGDPRQARMMLVMPFVFTFMFLNLPSGLVLYWFVSNLLQIMQQWWMDRAGRVGARENARA